jgi:transcriptional regulator with XRE-family HTH domain
MSKEATGERLLLARRKRNLTQKALAELCGFPYQIISRVERGEQDLYAQRLAIIAKELGVTADYLLGLPLREGCRDDA